MHSGAACGIRYSGTVQHAIRVLAVVMGCCGSLKRQSHVWQSCRIELLFKKQLTRLEDTLAHDKPVHWSVLEFTHNRKTLFVFCPFSLFCVPPGLWWKGFNWTFWNFQRICGAQFHPQLNRKIRANIRACSSEWEKKQTVFTVRIGA